MFLGFNLQNTEPAVLIGEGDPLDQPRKALRLYGGCVLRRRTQFRHLWFKCVHATETMWYFTTEPPSLAVQRCPAFFPIRFCPSGD